MKINQRGFGAVAVLLIIVVVGVIGFAGWYLLQANSKVEEKQASANQENTKAKIAVVSLKIGDTTVKVTVPDTINDLAVAKSSVITVNGVPLTWAVLATDTLKTCEGRGGGVIGSIYKISGKYTTYPLGGIEESEGVYVKQYEEYYLLFQGPQSFTCGDDAPSGEVAYKLVKQAMVDDGWVHKTK